MVKCFWCACPNCDETWVAAFITENGGLEPMSQHGSECSDCGSDEIEVQDEYASGDES